MSAYQSTTSSDLRPGDIIAMEIVSEKIDSSENPSPAILETELSSRPRSESGYNVKDEPRIELKLAELHAIDTPGQFGRSYRAKFAHVGDPTIGNSFYFIKTPPDAKAGDVAEHYNEMRERFLEETKKGLSLAFIKHRSDSSSSDAPVFTVPQPCGMGSISREGFTIPVLIYEHVEKPPGEGAGDSSPKRLGDILQGAGPGVSVKAERLLIFARVLAQLLQRIHNNGIAHSYLVSRNIFVPANLLAWLAADHNDEKWRAYVVGFGYSTFCDHGSSYFLDQLTPFDRDFLAPERRASGSLGMLWHAADIYSLGAILFALVTGAPPRESLRDVDRLKQYIFDSLKSMPLTSENENILKIIDSCLRYEPDDRFSCIEDFLQAVSIAELSARSGGTEHNKETETNPRTPPADKRYHEFSKMLQASTAAGIFRGTIEHHVASVKDEVARMHRGHYEVYGGRDKIVTSLCRLLATAEDDSEYCTLTLPGYWTDENLGKNGRFLTMCKHMARHRLRIRRLFLVPCDFHNLPERDQEILEHQWEAVKHVDEYHRELKAMSPQTDPAANRMRRMEVHVSVAQRPEDLFEFERRGPLVGYLKGANESSAAVCLNFLSRGREVWHGSVRLMQRKISKVRFWTASGAHVGKFKADKEEFDKRWATSSPIGVYMGRQDQIQKVIKRRSLVSIVRGADKDPAL